MRIVTWNMQGAGHSDDNKWNNGVKPMFITRGAEIVCLQECGSVPGSASLIKTDFKGIKDLYLYYWGSDRKYYNIIFYNWDTGAGRCNLAIVTDFDITADVPIIWPETAPMWRPAMGISLAGGYLFTIHGISGGGPDIRGLLTAINKFSKKKYWITVGDYNRIPDKFPDGDWLLCPPDGDTHPSKAPNKMLDYGAVSTDLNNPTGHVFSGGMMSDHLPVLFDF